MYRCGRRDMLRCSEINTGALKIVYSRLTFAPMSDEIFKGHITFVNYEKHFATIDYIKNGKTKSVNCKTISPDGKKTHHFRVGDNIHFQLKVSDRGDKLTAYNVKFLYNTQLEVLLNKAVEENRFAGYLKKVDDDWLIKEMNSYIFFPLRVSKWETPPPEQVMNEVINFSIQNLGKRNQLYAELFSHSYIPEYKQALELFKQQKPVEAVVSRVSPYAAYLELLGGKIQSKLEGAEGLKEGDKLEVMITHITPYRAVVEKA
jgi:ribosomal protein S1